MELDARGLLAVALARIAAGERTASKATIQNVMQSNGVIHAVDTELLPG